MAINTNAIIGINLAIVIVTVNIFDVFNPVLLIVDKMMTKVILIKVFIPFKTGKAIISNLAKPDAIADQAIIVTNQPNKPTIKPIKSPKADLEY